MDKRIQRLWYLPKGWEGIAQPNPVSTYLNDPQLLEKASPLPCDWEKIKNSPYVFLSRSPLTFGHSQLVVPSVGDCEQDMFTLASKIIRNIISTFKAAFEGEDPCHEQSIFNPLAEYTLTSGPYIKTLILRASVQECTKKEYKVHLVPYFDSHDTRCKDRFQSIHKDTNDKTGGLLGWLGERENYVDQWEVDLDPKEFQLDSFANEHLKMADLAKCLHSHWPEK